jgi:hypothetical protein
LGENVVNGTARTALSAFSFLHGLYALLRFHDFHPQPRLPAESTPYSPRAADSPFFLLIYFVSLRVFRGYFFKAATTNQRESGNS